MDFTQIKCKLQRRHHNHYHSIKGFLYDLRQVFVNCAIYNKVRLKIFFSMLLNLVSSQFLSSCGHKNFFYT